LKTGGNVLWNVSGLTQSMSSSSGSSNPSNPSAQAASSINESIQGVHNYSCTL